MEKVIRRRRRKAEINIVPLVDVLIVLIFFFLVSMQFRDQKVLNIKPPTIETAGKNKVGEQIEIGVSQDGVYFFNGRQVNRDELTGLLRIASGVDKETLILLLSDESSELGDTTFVMDAARKAGMNNLRLQAR